MISRRRILTATAGAALVTVLGSQDQAQAVTKAKKVVKKKKPATAEKTAAAIPVDRPSTLDASLLDSVTKQVVFYSPHPDDELLSFGVISSEYVALGFEPIFVLLTKGSTTNAIRLLNGELESPGNGTRFVYRGKHDPVGTGLPLLTPEDIGNARELEFISSTQELAAKSINIQTHDLLVNNDIPLAEAIKTIRLTALRYPHAIHWTMSTMDTHPHHRIAGEALRSVAAELGTKTAYAISRPTWDQVKAAQDSALPEVPSTLFFRPTVDRMQRVENAALAYNAWNPAAKSYAVGYASVPLQFEALHELSDAQYTFTTPTLDSVNGWIVTNA